MLANNRVQNWLFTGHFTVHCTLIVEVNTTLIMVFINAHVFISQVNACVCVLCYKFGVIFDRYFLIKGLFNGVRAVDVRPASYVV